MTNNIGYGVVYTPDSLSEYVAALLLEEFNKDIPTDSVNSKSITILDPACGEGSLLLATEKALENQKFSQEFNLIGIDIEEDVIKRDRQHFDVSKYTFYSNDALLPSETGTPIEYWRSMGIEPELIIANPPWSSEKLYDKKRLTDAGYKFDVGQYDSYVLFIELCLNLLKNDGYMALIIPDSIFSSENCELRRYLAEKTQLKVISRLGEKLFPGVNRATTVLIVKKTRPTDKSETTCFRLSTDLRKAYFAGETSLLNCHILYSHSVLQKRFIANSGCIFDIDAQKDEESLLRKMERSAFKWNEVFHFGRGVEISKSGMVVTCPKCGVAQGYSKKHYENGQKKCTKCGEIIEVSQRASTKIIDSVYHAGYKKIYVGENLHRYAITGGSFVKMNVPGINYKTEELYEPPKILIRKTGLGINACIDYESTYISQTVYSCNYIQPNNTVPLEYYLGVLNSRVLYYYYLKKYGENEWKSHPYFTKDIIFSLPIPAVTETNASICRRIAEKVITMKNKYSRNTDLEIEKLVIAMYGLNSAELEIVKTEINHLPDLGAINHMKINEGELCLDT